MNQQADSLFTPSARHASACRARVNARLDESFRHIFEQSAPHVDLDPRDTARLVAAVQGDARVAPAVIAALMDVVDTIATEPLPAVESAFRRLFALDPDAVRPLHILVLGQEGLSEAAQSDLVHRFLSESLHPEMLAPIDREKAAGSAASVANGIEFLRQHAPQTYAGIKGVVSEIILARGVERQGVRFDGCSSFERWGAILLNAAGEKSDLEWAETLAHEGGHTALFGLSPVEYFVTNGEDELYGSPLRDDPRPVDGIYHATFVLARMHFAMNEIASGSTAPQAVKEEARSLMDRSARNFRDGYAVLAEHAKYTGPGRQIMADALAYMQSAGAVEPA